MNGALDPVRSYLQNRAIYRKVHREDRNAQKVLRYYLNQVAAFKSRLETAAQDTLPPEIEYIVSDSRKLLLEGDVGRSRSRRLESESSNERPEEGLLRRYVSPPFPSDFDKFLEDLYLVADLIHGKELFDLLRLDIWSSRPQLYEVWVMLSILRWLDAQGYKVELRRAESSLSEAPFEWDLQYSRESRPCATVFDSPGRPTGHLFYQLYRPSGDMPDISMLEGADPSSAPLWSLDPKHSPKGGYSLADYRRTAERYRHSFGAKLSLVVEDFPRHWSNPLDFGDGAKLLVDCNPSGSGLPILLAELQAFHPSKARCLLCVDFSSSFAHRRNDALQELRSGLRTSGEEYRFIDEYVCFAGSAVPMRGTENLADGRDPRNSPFGGRHVLRPPLRGHFRLGESRGSSSGRFVTDGGFDIPIEVAKTRLKNDLAVGVEVVT